MKLIDADYLKINGRYADMIKYKDNIVWMRSGPKFEIPGTILRFTANIDNYVPKILTHGSSTYETKITGSGPYSYEIVK